MFAADGGGGGPADAKSSSSSRLRAEWDAWKASVGAGSGSATDLVWKPARAAAPHSAVPAAAAGSSRTSMMSETSLADAEWAAAQQRLQQQHPPLGLQRYSTGGAGAPPSAPLPGPDLAMRPVAPAAPGPAGAATSSRSMADGAGAAGRRPSSPQPPQPPQVRPEPVVPEAEMVAAHGPFASLSAALATHADGGAGMEPAPRAASEVGGGGAAWAAAAAAAAAAASPRP
eukprot:208238-Chlamydomonas_euryale.AAC.1